MTFRLRSLPIPTISVIVGVALAKAFGGCIDWLLACSAWLVAVCVTIGTNMINDALDFKKGGDSLHRFGHRKVIRAGLLPASQVFAGGIVFFVLCFFFGIPLILKGGWILGAILLLSVVTGYCYTGGPYPISYNGLSELFILIFYGGICVTSVFYVQTGYLNTAAFLLSLQIGLLMIIPNATNNFRDMFEDVLVHKNTLAVRFGKSFARWEIAGLMFFPFVLNLCWFALDRPMAALLPLLIFPLAFLFVRYVWITEPGPIFNRFFGLSVLVLFLFGLLLSLGLNI
jgi:1,4-dihydroxy-2-naphthoate polyprenyltransferase